VRHASVRSDGTVVRRYGFAVVTWLLLVAMVLVVVQLVRNPALLPRAAVASTAGPPVPPAPTGSQAGGNLVTNWSFERGTAGWRGLGRLRLERATGRSSGSAALVRAVGTGPARVGIQFGAAAEAGAGSRYVATAWVRSPRPGLAVELSVVAPPRVAGRREQRGTARALTAAGGRWRRLTVTCLVREPASTVLVRLTAPRLGPGQAMLVDEVVLRRA